MFSYVPIINQVIFNNSRRLKLIFKYTQLESMQIEIAPSAYLQLNEYIEREAEVHLLEQFNLLPI